MHVSKDNLFILGLAFCVLLKHFNFMFYLSLGLHRRVGFYSSRDWDFLSISGIISDSLRIVFVLQLVMRNQVSVCFEPPCS